MSSERDQPGGSEGAVSGLEALKVELHVWRHNRKLYPGWLLAPYQTRERIWNNTKLWLDVGIAANGVWSERQLVVLWRELTWRLGICLQAVPDEALDQINRVVDDLGKPGGEGNEGDEVDCFPAEEGWPREFSPTARELRECRLACMLALLQGYRIRPDFEAFERVESQLHEHEGLSGDQQCHVLHQSCLCAMAELDSDRAQGLLARWPNEPEDDFWLARKAAVLMELGDLQAARRVADDALKRIRGRQGTGQTDFWKLSREGWCLRLLESVESFEKHASAGVRSARSARDEKTAEWENPAWKNRLDHRLESARCSPDTELRALQELVNKRLPPARPLQRVRNPPGFDTGGVSAAFRWSMDIPSDRLAPAINLLLASDTTGFSLAGDSGMHAMSWIRDEFPGLWAAFALRFGGIGIARDPDPSGETKPDSIRRTTLERLPKQHVERLFTVTLEELERTVDRAQAGRDGRMPALRGGVLSSAAQLSDIVTRLSMCLNADAREKLLALLLHAARIPQIRHHPAAQATIWHLAGRSVPFLEQDQLKNWFFKILLDLPLDSSQGERGRGLPSMSDNLRRANVDEMTRYKSEEVDTGIWKLIEEVGSSDIATRTDAALRTLLLADLNVLSDDEKGAFAQLLWDEVDECGLPARIGKATRMHVHANWPSPAEGQGVAGLGKWIIANEVEDRFGVAGDSGEEADGRKGVAWPDPGKYLPSLLDLAFHFENDPETFDKVFSRRSRSHVLKSVLKWWKREGHLFGRAADASMLELGDVFERVDLSLRVVFECALGKEELEEQVRKGLVRFLDDIDGFGRSSPYKYPVLACMDRSAQALAWNGIRNGLWSADQDIAYSSLIASWQWQRGAGRLDLEPMPESVLTVIVSAMASVEGAVGYHGYSVLRQLIESENLRIDDRAMQEILAAVESATGKLAYGTEHVGVSVSDQERRVHVRRMLAELIVCLVKRGVKVGPAGTSWIGEAREDSFVDIRKVARTCPV